MILTDVFRRHDLSGWGKAGWVVFLIILPFLGALIYLIANSDGWRSAGPQDVQPSGPRWTTTSGRWPAAAAAAAEIDKAKELLDSGAINQAEFEALKAKALA